VDGAREVGYEQKSVDQAVGGDVGVVIKARSPAESHHESLSKAEGFGERQPMDGILKPFTGAVAHLGGSPSRRVEAGNGRGTPMPRRGTLRPGLVKSSERGQINAGSRAKGKSKDKKTARGKANKQERRGLPPP